MKTITIILVSLFIAFMLYQIKESICPTNRTTYGGEQLSCSQYQKLIRDIEEQKEIGKENRLAKKFIDTSSLPY